MHFENDNSSQIKNLRKFLRRRGLKYTRQREAVWSAFRLLEGQHLSCEEIYRQSKAVSPRLSWATLYRTLKWMKEWGIIVKRDFGNGRSLYESGVRRMIHGHLVCCRCGKIIELEDKGIEDFWKKTTEKYGFEVFQQRVEGFGVCPECDAKTTASKAAPAG